MNIFQTIIGKIKTWAIEKGIDEAAEEGINFLDQAIHRLYDKKPRTTAIGIIFLQALINEVLEDLAAKTKTTIDDTLVKDLKEEFEKFAAEKNIPLIDLETIVLPGLSAGPVTPE